MGNILEVNEADLRALLETIKPEPGQECQVCHRLAPKEKKDDPTGKKRDTLSIHIPSGSPPLDPLLIELVDKYREQWPRDHAAMRQEIGLEVVGGRSWRYYAVHFATYACLMVPGLEPTEVG